MVERQQVGGELRRPVEVEQPAPQLARRLRRRRDRPPGSSPCRSMTRPPSPARRCRARSPAGSPSSSSSARFERAAAAPRGIVVRAAASPTTPCCARTSRVAARRPARRAAGTARAASSSSSSRTVPRGSNGCANARALARQLDRAHARGEPVAEPAVDRRLGRPQVCDRVAARATVLELRLHHRRQHAAPAVRRQHADDGDPAAGTEPPPGTDMR